MLKGLRKTRGEGVIANNNSAGLTAAPVINTVAPGGYFPPDLVLMRK